MQRIKKNLIESAKIKKDYAKLKQRQGPSEAPASLELHPERQAMLANAENAEENKAEPSSSKRSTSKPKPFRKEIERAQRAKEERKRRQKEFEEMQQQKQRRYEERAKFRKAVEKARRPDHKGQRRLGRESKLLPGMVENLIKKLDMQRNQQ